MSASRQRWSKAVSNRQLVAGLLLGLFLFILSMTQFGALHRLVHPDASKASHQCAVTMLNSGQVETAPSATSVAVVSFIVVAPLAFENTFILSVDYSLLPGRGPPVSLS